MLRRKTKDERRENFIGFTALAGVVGAFAFGLTGCSDGNTAGVFTETESGQQASTDENGDKVVNVDGCSDGIPSNLKKKVAASVDLDGFAGMGGVNEIACITYDRDYTIINIKGTALDENGSAVKNARVLLKRPEMEYTSTIITTKETTTDDQGSYSFKDVILKATYPRLIPEHLDYETDEKGNAVIYYDYTLQVESEDKSIASYTSLNLRDAEKVTEGKTTYRQISSQELHKTSSQEIRFNKNGLSAGSSVCLDYSGVCHTLTDSELAQGSFLMENIPEGAYRNLCKLSNNAGSIRIECTILDTPVITGESEETISFKLPDDAAFLLDSMEDKFLSNVIVPVPGKDVSASTLLANSSSLSRLTEIKGSQNYWAEVSFSSDMDKATYSLIEGSPTGTGSNILLSEKSLQDTTITKGVYVLEQRNIGYSFKFAFDGSKSDSAEVLLSTLEMDWDSASYHGFDVRQCEAGSKKLCTRIYTRGNDSTYENLAFFDESDILDGEEHQFAFALAGSHLTLAVDGEVIRDTDLKLYKRHESYVSWKSFVTIGNVEVTDFVAFRITSGIKQSNDNSWNRLKAWLTAHQLLSK